MERFDVAVIGCGIDDGVSFYEHQVARDDGIVLFRGHARFLDEALKLRFRSALRREL